MMLVAGTLYNFSAYSPSLKDEMSYTQTQVNLIGTLGDVGLYCAFTMGLLYDRFGHRVTSVIASALVGGGYLLSYLSVKEIWWNSPFWVLVIFYILIGQGSYGINISALDVNIKNYSKQHRGKVTGLLAGGFGLSSAMFTGIYSLFFSDMSSVAPFILFMAISVASVALLGGLMLKLQHYQELPPEERILNEEKSPLLPTPREQTNAMNLTPFQMMKQADFWLLFVCLTFGSGAGMMVINNIGSIRLTFGGDSGDETQTFLIVAFSTCNFLGRLAFGFLSDRFQNALPRSFWLSTACGIMAASHLLFFLFPSIVMSFVMVVGTGIAYGGIFATAPTLVSIFFGIAHFGANYGVCLLAPAMGSFGFGYLSGAIYEHHADDDGDCTGHSCYSLTFAITAAACATSMLVGFYLTKRRGFTFS